MQAGRGVVRDAVGEGASSADADRRDPPEGISMPRALTDAVAYALRLAQEASFDAYLRRVGSAALKPGRYSVLMILADNPGIRPTALSRVVGRDKSTMTATLRDLETAGLIARLRSPEDKRSYGVELTPHGRALLDRLRGQAEIHDRALDRIVGPDKAALMAILARIAAALSDPETDPAA